MLNCVLRRHVWSSEAWLSKHGWSYTCKECCWRTSTEKNTCSIARFPCGSTAFLFVYVCMHVGLRYSLVTSFCHTYSYKGGGNRGIIHLSVMMNISMFHNRVINFSNKLSDFVVVARSTACFKNICEILLLILMLVSLCLRSIEIAVSITHDET